MGEIVNINHSNEVEVVRTENDLMELTVGMLLDARATIYSGKTLSVPIYRAIDFRSWRVITYSSIEHCHTDNHICHRGLISIS